MSLAERLPALARFIAEAAQATIAHIVHCRPLAGGAIQENWVLEVELSDGPQAGRHELVLRTDALSNVAVSRSRAEEFALIQTAHRAGVAVPEPLWLGGDLNVLGKAFFLMRKVPGVAAGHRLAKDPGFPIDRIRLAERLGEELAKIHALVPPQPDLEFLGTPSPHPALDRIAEYRRHLDALGLARPGLEYGLAWAERHAPEPTMITLTHQDYRTGNYLVNETGLAAILDWEFADWGDPDADLGWFCARCWRFGAVDREAGGVGARADFIRGYERGSGRHVEPGRVRFWEVMAHLRWAVIALQQADRHVSGREPSLELALTGRIPVELELEALRLIGAADPLECVR
ncbi:MAG TPA: phosphotransferase family protein [Alphaproteobacteria bacterium]|nr:phosphotransferase family protein [Alphaproteobacteria bacterium]